MIRAYQPYDQPPTPEEEHEWHFLYNPFSQTITVDEDSPENPLKLFLSRPLYAPLLFPNISSDTRDHCANERTFLSWLRLSIYLAIVSIAIFINFHLKSEPTEIEQKISHPLGAIFWVLALACLVSGIANYMRTVAKYAKRRAIVQSGIKTQIMFGVIALAIIAACAVFLGSDAQGQANRVRSED